MTELLPVLPVKWNHLYLSSLLDISKFLNEEGYKLKQWGSLSINPGTGIQGITYPAPLFSLYFPTLLLKVDESQYRG